jgi:hypothetical protein
LNQCFIRVQSPWLKNFAALRQIQFAFARQGVILVSKCQRNNSLNQTNPRRRKVCRHAAVAAAADADAAIPRQLCSRPNHFRKPNRR